MMQILGIQMIFSHRCVMQVPKPKTFRSDKYLVFIREHPCLVCGNPRTVAHHEGLGKNIMGGKPPDSHAVPLCSACHSEYHNGGPAGFWARDVRMEIIGLLTEYLQDGDQDGQNRQAQAG